MSRIGRRPVSIPAGVTITSNTDGTITVKGPKGALVRRFNPDLNFNQNEGTLVVERPTDSKEHRSLHGLSRTLLSNMVEGVTNGYQKQLEIQGVGFRAQLVGEILQISVGYSHLIEVWPREGITFTVANDPQSRNQGACRADRRRDPQAPQTGTLQRQRHPLQRRICPPQAGQGRREGRQEEVGCVGF
jgi:large subunit ribosomal protein L6